MRPVIALLTSSLLLVQGTLAEATLPPAPLPTYTPAERRHWAFQPIQAPEVPAFTAPADKAWVRTPVDAFILDKLKKEGLRPAARRRIAPRCCGALRLTFGDCRPRRPPSTPL